MAGQAGGEMGDRAVALFGAIALAVGDALGWGDSLREASPTGDF
jgi:hypothetical protein